MKVKIEDSIRHPYATLLCYPRPTESELTKRLRELKSLGVTALEFTGQKEVSGIPVLGKGCVGIVAIAYVGSKRMALKIRRLDADRSTMRHEATMLKKANAIGVGPNLHKSMGDFLLMELIEGNLLPNWLERSRPKTVIRRVLRELLLQCRRLDETGLDHGELSHAPKHVIVDNLGRPCIVDFETASTKRRPSNVTAMCQYCFISGPVADKIAEMLGKKEKEKVANALRDYKNARNEEYFGRVLSAVGL